jgi:hypothetical protein
VTGLFEGRLIISSLYITSQLNVDQTLLKALTLVRQISILCAPAYSSKYQRNLEFTGKYDTIHVP